MVTIVSTNRISRRGSRTKVSAACSAPMTFERTERWLLIRIRRGVSAEERTTAIYHVRQYIQELLRGDELALGSEVASVVGILGREGFNERAARHEPGERTVRPRRLDSSQVEDGLGATEFSPQKLVVAMASDRCVPKRGTTHDLIGPGSKYTFDSRQRNGRVHDGDVGILGLNRLHHLTIGGEQSVGIKIPADVDVTVLEQHDCLIRLLSRFEQAQQRCVLRGVIAVATGEKVDEGGTGQRGRILRLNQTQTNRAVMVKPFDSSDQVATD